MGAALTVDQSDVDKTPVFRGESIGVSGKSRDTAQRAPKQESWRCP